MRKSPVQNIPKIKTSGHVGYEVLSWVKAAKLSIPRTKLASEWLVQANEKVQTFDSSSHWMQVTGQQYVAGERKKWRLLMEPQTGTPTSIIHRSKNQGPRTDVVK